MAIYTVLGGTGSTGSSVIKALLRTPPPDLTLRVYVRSKKKLVEMIPLLLSQTNVQIIESTLNDIPTLAKCLKDSVAIFSCIAASNSEPGMSIAVDTNAAVTAALQDVRREASTLREPYIKPVILMISSASVNKKLLNGPPPFVQGILDRALFYVYEDLRIAQELFQRTCKEDPDLLEYIFVQPPAILVSDELTGHALSTVSAAGITNFTDLGAAMVEMFDRRAEFVGQGVCVRSTGQFKEVWTENYRAISLAAAIRLFPGVWKLGRRWGWW